MRSKSRETAYIQKQEQKQIKHENKLKIANSNLQAAADIQKQGRKTEREEKNVRSANANAERLRNRFDSEDTTYRDTRYKSNLRQEIQNFERQAHDAQKRVDHSKSNLHQKIQHFEGQAQAAEKRVVHYKVKIANLTAKSKP